MAAIDLYFPNLQAGEGPGGWGAYAPPEPTPPSEATQPGAAGEGPGGWGVYTQAAPKVPREIGGGEAAMRGALSGASFGFYPAMAGAASGISAAMQGQDFGPAYTQTRTAEEEAQQQAQEQHPYLYGGAAAAGTLPYVFVPGLGAEAVGAQATGALGRIGRSALAGAKFGGLFGTGEQVSAGAEPIDIAKGAAGGAAAGGAVGGVLGSAIEGAVPIAQKTAGLFRAARDVEQEAGSRVASAVAAGRDQLQKAGADRAAIQAGREAGTPLTIADVGGESTRALMRSAANQSPQARQAINDVVQTRYQQQADRFSNWIRSKFGGFDRAGDLEALQDAAAKANAPKYRVAYARGNRPIQSPELERLTGSPDVVRAMAEAATQGKSRAIADGYGAFNPGVTVTQDGRVLFNRGPTGVPTYPNLQFWDYTYRSLRDAGDAAFRAGRNSEGNYLSTLSKQLRSELDKIEPSFAQARSTAASYFKAQDALEAGANFVRDASIGDAQAARAIAKMSPAEQQLFRRGFASALADEIDRRGYTSDVLKSVFIASPRAQRRIQIALGKDGAEQFEGLMRIEGLIDRTRTALGNSTTVRQAQEAGLAAAGGAGLAEGLLNPISIIVGGLVLGGRAAAKHIDEQLATKIAEMLMSNDPATIQRGYKIVSQNAAVRTALRRASDLTGSQIVNHLGARGVAAAAATGFTYLRGRAEKAAEQPSTQQEDQGTGYGEHQPGSP